MKTPQCDFNMKLRLDRRRNRLIVHFSEPKTCKGTDIQIVAPLYMLFVQIKMSFSLACLSKLD